jgi:hypothetical protein
LAWGALRFSTGNGNIAIGREAGTGITTGNNIITIGPLSGLSTTNGQVDDSCYIDNIFDAGVDAGTAIFVFVDQDGKLGTTALPGSGNLPSRQRQPVPQGPEVQAMLNGKVDKLQATVAQQHKQIEVLTAQLKEQAAQIQKVSDQVELSKPAPRMVASDQ